MMKKRYLSAILYTALSASLFAACSGAPANEGAEPGASSAHSPVTLNVTTTFSGSDGNGPLFRQYTAKWEAETGNTVSDGSATSDEIFKSRVLSDFEAGVEPDVLFYFNGVDSNPFVRGGKVVSIDEIREVYPEYAANLKDGMLGASPVDGVNYSVPVNGYWEGLFVNKAVLEACGLEVPGADYTWEDFIADCEGIKSAGYTPIAAALADVPHYWFEFTIYNHLGVRGHNILPESSTGNAQRQGWISGLTDIRDLFERGFFPENTLSATDNETFQMFLDSRAAFLIDGSWKLGAIENSFKDADAEFKDLDGEERARFIEDISNFTVTYVPAGSGRSATDIIGGLSSGYYITRKAWDNPEKRDAAVSFVMYMTSDVAVSDFAKISATALKNGAIVDESSLSPLAADGLNMVRGATGITGAVQDQVPNEAREPVFGNMPQLVTGAADISQAVSDVIALLG